MSGLEPSCLEIYYYPVNLSLATRLSFQDLVERCLKYLHSAWGSHKKECCISLTIPTLLWIMTVLSLSLVKGVYRETLPGPTGLEA